MNTNFTPDYTNIQDAARNKTAARLPLYEHIISDEIMEEITGKKFRYLADGDYKDKVEYYRHYCNFFKHMGYDGVSFECCIGPIMPGTGCLGGHMGQKESTIKCRADFEKYPWDELPDIFFKAFENDFRALSEAMPAGMKAIGGVGNGIFECVQEIIGFTNLCYYSIDDPELYAEFFKKMGEAALKIWERFMASQYSDTFCVLRMGDDLGFKSSTLISAEDIRRLIIPEYAKIVACVHHYNKPFLFHSCGDIFDVMPDLINVARINAKHSNEDQIAMFPKWVTEYGDKIGNFGGIDTDAVCRLSVPEIREYVTDVLKQCEGRGGIAFGSGNSIPNYVPVDNYVEMVNAVRRYRGESF